MAVFVKKEVRNPGKRIKYITRMYDPLLGRFLSPDRFVQIPDYSQNFNKYSYCLNNSLRYTDPDAELIFTLICTFVPGMQVFLPVAVAAGHWQYVDKHTPAQERNPLAQSIVSSVCSPAPLPMPTIKPLPLYPINMAGLPMLIVPSSAQPICTMATGC